jgi:hypothetical protein
MCFRGDVHEFSAIFVSDSSLTELEQCNTSTVPTEHVIDGDAH